MTDITQYPIFEFGSPELDILHKMARDHRGRINSDFHHYQYVVDHGNNYFTLNTMLMGQVVPYSLDIPKT